jgi:hypothetical protein
MREADVTLRERVKNPDMEEVARFVAMASWLDRLDRECLRWGVPRSQVIVDAVTRYALGPEGLKALYGPDRKISSHRRGGKVLDDQVVP